MKIAVIIPARGGSKGLPGKNIRDLGGRPLIAHSIDQAARSELVTDIFVSTDCPKIKQISELAGATVVLRPDSLSGDTCSSESALLHCLDVLSKNDLTFDLIVFLQCTSPIRKTDDIDNAIKQIVMEKSDSLLSVIPNHRFLWRFTQDGAESINYDYLHRPRRQDMSLQYQENGSIYIFKPWVLQTTSNRLGGKISMFVMDEMSAIDIDSEFDFKLAESVLQRL